MVSMYIAYVYLFITTIFWADSAKLGFSDYRWREPVHNGLPSENIQVTLQSMRNKMRQVLYRGEEAGSDEALLNPAEIYFQYPACSKERLGISAACNCYVAEETGLITAKMSEECDEVFEDIRDETPLAAGCLPFANPDFTLNLETYQQELEQIVSCSSNSVRFLTFSLYRQGTPSNSPPPPTPPPIIFPPSEENKRFGKLTEDIGKYSGLNVPITEDISGGWFPIFSDNRLSGVGVGFRIQSLPPW